jgi:hypothetical protein
LIEALTPQTLPVHDSDVVGDINQHTHGTEFYGTSSNFVLLNQLFAFAQQHLPPGHARSSGCNETSYLSPSGYSGNDPRASGEHISGPDLATLPQGRISIINLLSNEEALSMPPSPKTPTRVTNKQPHSLRVPLVTSSRTRDGNQQNSIQHDNPMLTPQYSRSMHAANHTLSFSHLATSDRPMSVTPIRVAERQLEREYVRLFMNNLHHLHPMLDPTIFTARCEEEIWDAHTPPEGKKHLRHFLALHKIVVAIGALVAESSVSRDFRREIKLCMEQVAQPYSSRQPISSQTLSKNYFRKSRELLGDVFEVCSLESAQTLLLMVNSLV